MGVEDIVTATATWLSEKRVCAAPTSSSGAWTAEAKEGAAIEMGAEIGHGASHGNSA